MVRRSLVLIPILTALGCGEMKANEPPPTVLTGSARVTWKILRSGTSEEIECGNVRVESAAVSVGAQAVGVNCGDEQALVFEGLIAGRFPVIVQLRTLGGRVTYERRDNVIVVAGGQVDIEVIFEIDPDAATKGSVVVEWQIDREEAATGCPRIGGNTVRVTDLPGSIATVLATAPCADGTLTLPDLRPGLYGFFLELFDADNTKIAVTSISLVEVEPGETATPDVASFITELGERARLFAQWTIDSTVAAAGCASANADAIILRGFPGNENVATITATAACSAGSLTVEDVAPGLRRHRIVLQLYRDYFTLPPLPVLLTSTIVRDVIFDAGATSTVSVDLLTQ